MADNPNTRTAGSIAPPDEAIDWIHRRLRSMLDQSEVTDVEAGKAICRQFSALVDAILSQVHEVRRDAAAAEQRRKRLEKITTR